MPSVEHFRKRVDTVYIGSLYIMEFVGKVVSGVKGFYNGINSSTLSGSIDVIVVKDPNGEYRGSAFHVRFGKLQLLHTKEKLVRIEVNGKLVRVTMRLGDNGEAYFVPDELLMLGSKNVSSRIKIQKKFFKTTGDRFLNEKISDLGNKGLFSKEIDEALLKFEINLGINIIS